MSRSRLWKFAATGAVLTAILGACATNPVTGRREVSIVTPAQELEIGRQGYGPVTEEYGLYGDAALSAYVNSIGQ
jgi:predicted Zn-dependent protease